MWWIVLTAEGDTSFLALSEYPSKPVDGPFDSRQDAEDNLGTWANLLQLPVLERGKLA
jgi:hypothetical protein